MMKKNMILILSAIAIAVTAITLPQATGKSKLSATQLSNIEALTGAESSGSEVVKCYCKVKLFSNNICSANASGSYCGGNPCSNHDGNCR